MILIFPVLVSHGQELSPLLGGNKPLKLDDPVPTEPPLPTEKPPEEEPTAPVGEDKFTFDQVRSLAAARALRPYVERKADLAPFWKELAPKDYQRIRPQRDKAFWKGTDAEYLLEGIHPGGASTRIVNLAEIVENKAQVLNWDPAAFDYTGVAVPSGTLPPPGYAGFKILTPLNEPQTMDELVRFDGASLFRCLAPALVPGIGARGVSLNAADPETEEFPSFEHFWIERPNAASKAINFYSLLDGPSVAGAYRFRVTPGRSTVMEVEAELTFRQEVTLIGFAPLSSMFWFSELTHPKPMDYRSQVHNSDGLLIHVADGEAIWRPLDISKTPRRSVIQLEKFIGFGLMQRDRNFANYQDLEANYQSRPSAYIEPVGKWPAGKIHLLERPTNEAHWDNVAVFWEPDVHPKPGQPFRIGYRIHWLNEMSVGGLSKVTGSRRSQTSYTAEEKRPNIIDLVVDFAQLAKLTDEQKDVIAAVDVSVGGRLLEKTVQKIPATGGWRATFRVQIEEKTDTLELGCRLIADGRPVSERWNYQWKK